MTEVYRTAPMLVKLIFVFFLTAGTASPAPNIVPQAALEDFFRSVENPRGLEGRWLALVPDGDGWHLVPTEAVLKTAREAEETVYRLVPDRTGARMLLRNIRGIAPGPVQSYELHGSFWGERPAIEVRAGRLAYTIRLAAQRQDRCDAVVTLSDGERSQVLYDVTTGTEEYSCDEPHFNVEWAGDLDGDARLDLLTNMNRKYSVHQRRLYLSSHAAPGDLVGLAATMVRFSC